MRKQRSFVFEQMLIILVLFAIATKFENIFHALSLELNFFRPEFPFKGYLSLNDFYACATGKIQRNNYHHGSCGSSLTGKTSSVSLIFTHRTHRNVKNRRVRSSLNS